VVDDDAFEWKGRTRVARIHVVIRPDGAELTWRRVPPVLPHVLAAGGSIGAGAGAGAIATWAGPLAGLGIAWLVPAAAGIAFMLPLAAWVRWQRRVETGARVSLDATGLRVDGPDGARHCALESLRCVPRTGLGIDGREWRLAFVTATAEIESGVAFVDQDVCTDVALRLDRLVARLREQGGYR